MSNNPATRNVLRYKGGGSVQVYPNLPTMVNDSQDGSDVPSTIEGPGGHTFAANRNVEFLNDRYVNTAVSGISGIFKRNEGGAGVWGRIGPGITSTPVSSIITGLHVLHPNGVPTMFYVTPHQFASLTFAIRSENGTSTTDTNIEGVAVATQMGQSIVYRQSVFWAHNEYAGSAGTGAISAYDLVTSTLTRYDVSAILFSSNLAASYAFHVHGNVMFLFGWNQGVNSYGTVLKLSAGVFVSVYTDTSQYPGAVIGSSTGHSAIFTDPATGDLIVLMSGSNQVGDVPRSKVVSISDATGAATPTDRSTAVMGATEGADKYLTGGGAANEDRRWSVFVDAETTPGTPRTYLTTWVPGGSTETWEWKGIGAEMEAVASLQGISDDFALPYETAGGGERSPRVAALEINGQPAEIAGGTSFPLGVHGTGPLSVATFRGTDSEGTPSTIVPIVPASLTFGAGLLTALLAYWKFDSSLSDSSINSLTLTQIGTVGFAAALINDGADFSGVDGNYLEVTTPSYLRLGITLTPFSISCWVDLDTLTGANKNLCSQSNDSTQGWALNVNLDGSVRFIIYGGVSLTTAVGLITTGSGFQHVVVTSDGTALKIYIDNVLRSTGVTVIGANSAEFFSVGASRIGTKVVDGKIDELAFWSKALDVNEVGYLYNAGAGFELEGVTPFVTPPSISGNTIINLLPDNGSTPYAITLDVDAPGVNINEGDVGGIIAELA